MRRIFHICPRLVFCLVFVLLLVLYWPAREAGWVSDTLGWLDAVQRHSFGDFINRKGFGVRSLYQTTQAATWSLYQLFGANRLAWHLVHVVLQALNAALLFAFFRQLLVDFRVTHAPAISLAAVLLFSLNPTLSEVIVWEAAYHYLQGLLFIALQLLLLQRFLHSGRIANALIGTAVFAVASFSLELFYLSPAFSALLLLAYRFGNPALERERIRRASRTVLLPQLFILALHLLLLRITYGDSSGRLGTGLWEQPLSYFAIKPPDYLLHLAGGRFLPQGVRSAWHQAFCTYAGAGLFYALLTGSLSYMLFRFRRMGASAQLIGWAWCATLAAMALVTPMWFPERLLVMGDRYLYLMLPFFSLMVCVGTARLHSRMLAIGVMSILLLLSIFGTSRLAGMWGDSERLTALMQRRLPGIPGGGPVLLLNPPANYYGIPMTGASPEGEFALMRRLLYPEYGEVGVREAFAVEYGPGVAAVNLQGLSPGIYRIGLRDTAGRLWFGADYAKPVEIGGCSLQPVSPAAYELHLDSGMRPPVFVVWAGTKYGLMKATY